LKKITFASSVGSLALTLALPLVAFASSPTFTASQSVASAVAGTNDQTAVTAVTQANGTQVKATRTLTVNSLPAGGTTSVIGSCTVTYATAAGDSLSCSGNAATISVTTHPSTATVAAALSLLTGLSDAGHGALTVSTSGFTDTFTTTGTESTSTPITFTDGTSGAVSSTASTNGTVPVAQINTLTIGGTVDTGDVFVATLPTVGAVNYTVLSSDTTTSLIATGLLNAILSSAGYAGQVFTVATSTNTLIFTAKTAGTGFTQTSSAANRALAAQQVVFTPSNVSSGYTFRVTINGTDYTSQSAALSTVLSDITSALSANTAVTCSQNGTAITCTAVVPGVAFTYATSVVAIPVTATVTTHRSSGTRHLWETATTPIATQPQLAAIPTTAPAAGTPATSSPTTLSRNFGHGSKGSDVQALQVWLNAHGYAVASSGPGSAGHETTSFGTLTKKALAKFQAAEGISPASGFFGPKTRAVIK
jgi:hypothetical protein